MSTAAHIVLTGGSGFLGTHLRRHLAESGLAHSEIQRDHVVVNGVAHPHNGDSQSIAQALAPIDNLVLVHLAAHFVSRHNPSDLSPLVAGTVGFSTLVYDAFFKAGGRPIVIASSAWQYDEIGQPKSANLYAALKSAALNVLSFYQEQYAAPASELVFFDTYGPEDSRPKLIPLLVQSCKENRHFQASAGLQPINITHVDDVCRAILQAVELTRTRDGSGLETYAVKSASEMPVRALIEMIRDDIAPQLDVTFRAATPVDAPKRLNHTFPTVPGWEPRVALRDGLSYLFER